MRAGVTYLRNFIFGVEDSLVSTVGLLSGVSIAAGSFLSETSAEEYSTGQSAAPQRPLLGGFVMFASYFLAGFIPLFPYMVVAGETAFMLSISLSVAALFALGATSG